MRIDGRLPHEIRSLHIQPEVIRHAEGSVLIRLGHTHLVCTASIEPGVPKWLQGSGRGWLTAEYGMLPRATHSRINREKAAQGGRTQEISRLIGRALRAGVSLERLGERQVYIDCDVIQADGGTRTAAITGGFIALALALKFLVDRGDLPTLPIHDYIAAISVGRSAQGALLDLNYDEDSSVDTDMNFVMNSSGKFVEVQGTAEKDAFSRQDLIEMLDLAEKGCGQLFRAQQEILGDFLPLPKKD